MKKTKLDLYNKLEHSRSHGYIEPTKKVSNLTGKRFGRLTVLSQLEHRQNKRIVWNCMCDCGNYKDVKGVCLTTGETKSCGCLKK